MQLPNNCNVATLKDIAFGAVQERFQHSLSKVLDNIFDENYDPAKVREINIKTKLKPNQKKQTVDYSILVSENLSPLLSLEGTLHIISDEKGHLVAVEQDLRQPDLPLEENDDVIDINSKKDQKLSSGGGES